jgi:hypothetical protein
VENNAKGLAAPGALGDRLLPRATLTFRLLIVFVGLRYHRRELIRINVTDPPTAAGTARPIVEAFPDEAAPGEPPFRGRIVAIPHLGGPITGTSAPPDTRRPEPTTAGSGPLARRSRRSQTRPSGATAFPVVVLLHRRPRPFRTPDVRPVGAAEVSDRHRTDANASYALFARHGFEVHQNVSGYAGGNIVATFGHPHTRRVHAIQLEINASFLMTTSSEEFIAQVSRGGIPDKADVNIARLRQVLQEVVATLPSLLATPHEA